MDAWETAIQSIRQLKSQYEDLMMAVDSALFDLDTGNTRVAKTVLRSALHKAKALAASE